MPIRHTQCSARKAPAPGCRSPSADWVWIVDPIDGTTNFAHGYPHFAVSIAVVHQGVGEIGVVYDPSRDELFTARQGGRATLNGRPIRVSTIDVMVAPGWYGILRMTVTSRKSSTQSGTTCRANARESGGKARPRWGWHGSLPGGLTGSMSEPINAWDVGAGAIIVEAAGGVVTAIDGSPYDVFGQELAASNGLIHAELIEAIGAAHEHCWNAGDVGHG